MDNQRYNVVLTGETLNHRSASDAAAALASLIKRDIAFASSLLQGKRVTIKSGIDQATASKYIDALTRVGVAARVETERPEVDETLEIDACVGKAPVGDTDEPDDPAKELLSAYASLYADGVDANVLPNGRGEYGLDKNNPIPTASIDGSEQYLSGLRYGGVPVEWQRSGSVGSDATPAPVDAYRLHVGGKDVGTAYICPYHKRNSSRAPKGFTLTWQEAKLAGGAPRMRRERSDERPSKADIARNQDTHVRPWHGFLLAFWLMLMGGAFPSLYLAHGLPTTILSIGLLGALCSGTIFVGAKLFSRSAKSKAIAAKVDRFLGAKLVDEQTAPGVATTDGEKTARLKPVGALPNALLLMLYMAVANYLATRTNGFHSGVYVTAVIWCLPALIGTIWWNASLGPAPRVRLAALAVTWLSLVILAIGQLGVAGIEAGRISASPWMGVDKDGAAQGRSNMYDRVPSTPADLTARLVGIWDCHTTNIKEVHRFSVNYSADRTMTLRFSKAVNDDITVRWYVGEDMFVYEQVSDRSYHPHKLDWVDPGRTFESTTSTTGAARLCTKRGR